LLVVVLGLSENVRAENIRESDGQAAFFASFVRRVQILSLRVSSFIFFLGFDSLTPLAVSIVINEYRIDRLLIDPDQSLFRCSKDYFLQ
jgi:hypothetical protein